MAKYLPLPDGSSLKVPDAMTYEEAMSKAQGQFPELFKPASTAQTGIMADIKGAGANLLNIGRTGIAALTGDTTQAAEAGVARQEELQKKYKSGFDPEKITDKFNQGEYLGAAGEALRQAPSAMAGLIPSLGQEAGLALAGRVGGGALGALVPIPGAAAVGSQIGQYAVPLVVNAIQALGSQAQEKVQTQREAGEKVDVNAAQLAPYAIGNAALNLVGTKIAMPSIFKKMGGEKVAGEVADAAAAATRKELIDEARKVAGRGTFETILRGTGGFALGELPTEVLQDVVDRAAVGKNLTDEDAFKSYRSTALNMLLAAPLGGGFGVHQRMGARETVAAEDKVIAAKNAMQAAAEAEAAKSTPEALTKLDADYQAATKRMQELQAATAKKPTKASTDEERAAYNTAKAERDTFQREELAPIKAEYEKRKGAITQMQDKQLTDLEQAAAAGQPTATALTPNAAVTVPMPKLMERYDQIRSELDGIQEQLAAGPELEAHKALSQQRQVLSQQADAYGKLLETRGGLAMTGPEHAQAVAEADRAIARKDAERKKQLAEGAFPEADKTVETITKMQQDRDALAAKRPLFQETQAYKESKPGETQQMFSEQEMPAPVEQKVPQYASPEGKEITPPAPETAAPISTEVVKEAPSKSVQFYNERLAEAVQAKDATRTGEALHNLSEEENKIARSKELPAKDRAIWDLFSIPNLLANGDPKTIEALTRAGDLDKQAKRDANSREEKRMQQVLDERLGLGGAAPATETGKALRSVKRERADLFGDLYNDKAKALFKNGNSLETIEQQLEKPVKRQQVDSAGKPVRGLNGKPVFEMVNEPVFDSKGRPVFETVSLQDIYDKGGSEAVEMAVVMDQIRALKKKVETPQGNAKKSLYQTMLDMAAEHESLLAQRGGGVAAQTMGEKAATLQAKLGKGEAPAARQMTAKEKDTLNRRIKSIENQYNAVLGKVEPVRKQIEAVYSSLYKTTPLETVEKEREAKKALLLPETGARSMSKTARTQARIESGDVRKEAETSQKMRDLARDLGQEMPEYQKMSEDRAKRLTKLMAQYGKADPAVAFYSDSSNEALKAKALELGKATPEYKATLTEQIAVVKEALAGSKQTLKSKRGTQTTRKVSLAKKEEATGSPESRELGAKRHSFKAMSSQETERLTKEVLASDAAGREEERFARGVEVESPDLTPSQVDAIKDNDIEAVLQDIANDKGTSTINRAVAARLALLLDVTDIKIVQGLTDVDGKEVLGMATSRLISLNADGGVSQEVLLHEGTHAGTERVIQMYEKDPSQLTETQRLAVRELKMLHAAAKADPRITSANAKSSLSEFVAEVMSNRNLQEQLRGKAWKLSDAWKGFKSIVMRMLGVTENTETMLGASITAIDALFIPTTQRFGKNEAAETAVAHNLAQKDIAALDSGSNSMREFAAQFGPEIKQKDRTPEDADRIGKARLKDMQANPADYVAPAEPEKLDYSVKMSDGKQYDENNLRHYVEADAGSFAYLKAQKDEDLRKREARTITEQRTDDLQKLVKELFVHPEYTYVEQALVAKAASKYAVVANPDGSLRLVTIDPSNRHNVAVVGAKGAAAIIEELRSGKNLKDAFLVGMQRNAAMHAKDNQRKNGWQKFEQSDKEEDAVALNAGAAGTAWCTGASVSTARGQLERGDFYIHYTDGKPDVAVRMDGSGKIGEIRGNTPNQALTQTQQQLTESFLQKNAFERGEDYLKQMRTKQLLLKVLAGDVDPKQMMQLDIVRSKKIDDYYMQKMFRQDLLDGYGGRPRLTDAALNEAKQVLTQAIAKAYEANFFVGASVGITGLKNDVTAVFDGKEYNVNPATLRGAEDLAVYASGETGTQVWPALESLQYVSLVGKGVSASLPKVTYLKSVTGFPRQDATATLNLPLNATIDSVRPAGTSSSVEGTLIITGATEVRNVQTVENSILNVILPDALYVSKKDVINYTSDVRYAVKDVLEARLRTAKLDRYYEQMSSFEPNSAAAKIIDPFIKAYEALIPESSRQDLQDRRDTLSERQDGNALSADQEISAITDTLYGKKPAPVKRGEPRPSEIERVLAINKRVNATGLMGEKLLPTKEGTITAPKKIADTPVQELTEATEVPVYAPKTYGVKDEGKGEYSFRSKRTPGEFDATPEPSAVDKFLGNALGLAGRQQFVDKWASVSEAFKRGMNAGVLTDVEAANAEFLMRFSEHRSQYAGLFLTDGPVSLHTEKTAKGLIHTYKSTKGATPVQMAEALSKGGFTNDSEAEGMLTTYTAGQRAAQVGWDKLNYSDPAAEKAKYQRLLAILASDPKRDTAIKEAAKIYQQFNNGLIDFLVQTGELTAAKAAELKAITYIPFYRINAQGEVQLMIDKEHPIRIGNVKDEPQLHELVGDNKQIMPIFTSMVQNTFMLTNMALRNQSVKETAFALRKTGIVSRIAEGKGPASADTVRFKVKGKDFYAVIDTDAYGIPAKYIVQSMEGIKTTIPAIVRMLGVPADLLRTVVTRAPTYALRQVIRDPLNAWLTTGTDAFPVLSSFKELASMMAGTSETGRLLTASGAVSSNVFTGDVRDMGRVFREITTGKSGWGKLMARADTLAMQADSATRAVIYKDSIDKGMSHQAALLRAVESMNFGRRGLSPSMQMLNTLIPFFNAQIQGLDVLYRAFRGEMSHNEQLKIREKLVKRGLLLAMGTMAYAVAMQDDEAYKRAKPEERYGNWFVYVPGFSEPLRIPIPFELGYLFKALPEAIVNMAVGDTKSSEVIKGMGKLLGQSQPLALPQAVKPLTEVVLGASFYGGDIESQREKNELPQDRYRESTTEIAKLLGSVTGAVGISPIKIDHLIRGYTGGLGIALVQLANPILNTESEAVEKPSMKPSNMPFLGGLFQPVEGRGTLDTAYDRMLEIQQVKGSYNKLIEQGKRAEAQEFVQTYANQLALASTSGSVQKALGQMAAQERMIRASKMTTEQKDVALERLDKMKVAYARQFISLADRTRPQ